MYGMMMSWCIEGTMLKLPCDILGWEEQGIGPVIVKDQGIKMNF